MKKILIVAVILFFGAIATGTFWVRQNYQNGKLQEKIIRTAFPNSINFATTTNIIPRALGMEYPRTFLILFINNTELRPGGGFIGSYAVARFDHGRPEILKVEGTETIDNNSPGVGATPTLALAKYLGIKTWQFRDSNWSPDFPTDARRALEFYKAEHGYLADDISGVIAITPNFFEEILKLTGPLDVNGISFTSDNFTEKLEYEVEYGFEKRGIKFSDRKQILGDVSRVFLPRIVGSMLIHWSDYARLVLSMLNQKHLILYSTILDEQSYIEAQGWDGAMRGKPGDYLLWADANLGSLKTDVVITRSLSYSISSTATGTIATATMRYNHAGGFTWRTSRYRDYARIFAPSGSRLLGISGNSEQVDEGEEDGRHWFGTFLSISPGHQGQLSFTYLLPENINDQIQKGNYHLSAQKQLGTDHVRLTLELKFDKNLVGAEPTEASEKFGDNYYQVATDLRVDREFDITLAH